MTYLKSHDSKNVLMIIEFMIIELNWVSKCFYGFKIYLIWIPVVETLKPILHVFTMQAIHSTIAQKPIYNLYSHSHQ